MKHFTCENFPESNLGLLIGRAHALKDRLLEKHLVDEDITAAQFKVLIIMQMTDVDTPAELCRYLALDSGAMTRMLDRLEQKGFIVRERCDDDRRQIRLVLTGEGQRLAGRLPQIGAEAMNEMVGVLEPAELASLEQILKKILLTAGDSVTVMRIGDK
ncbi:MarR family transcriptional regulator [Pseudomonas sp. HR96]|uniref:MarR family winged helix-turn-helix transcriptional regulator n=1 Tax=Pseudomonas sp. HR96 TaxID=1027966 RepID=UPI002A75185F|nr:MarR family transcriptional regulator [Pseudomonas sp. HR96]WPP01458.1 MarR family transcriptional regulator [Pseudomonas sp. HR96]